MVMRRIGVAVLCVLCANIGAGLASAQENSEHAAHHPGSPTASVAPPRSDPGTVAGRPTGSMSGMMAGMPMDGDTEGEGHHGRRDRGPFYSRLLSYGDLNEAQRADLSSDADRRVHDGTRLVEDASMRVLHSQDPASRMQAADELAEGARLTREGAAAQAALSGKVSPQEVAANWYRKQLSIPNSDHQAMTGLWALSTSHLLLMLFLGLVSGALIVLQLLRLQRIRKLIATRDASATEGELRKGAPTLPHGSTSPSFTGAASAASPSKQELVPSNAARPGGASLRKPRSWNGDLRVAQIIRETPSIRTFRLAEPSADRLPFDFLPGQFLQVEVEPEPDKFSRRSYTIASSPTQRAYVEITVKREEQGAVSRFLHDQVKVGDTLKVSGPFGTFTFTGSDADGIVLIAGGVGITPMMSVLRYLTDIAWPGDIFFFYGARSTEEFVFREELERLERRFDNLHVLAAMQRAAGTVWLGPEGPLTREMLAAAVPDISRRRIHLCGPPAMMTAMREQLAQLGVPEAQIHTEAFGPASLPVEPVAVVEPVEAPIAASATPVSSRTTQVADTTITFSISGVSAALPADQTVLEAAEGAGVEIPYACRSGECGVCVTKLLDGEVSMAVETGLAAQDKADGYILACQAKACGKPLVVEA